MKRILVLALALSTGIACTNSGLAGTTDTQAGTGTTTNPGPSGKTCAWEGTWQVTQSWCGGIDISTDWDATYDTTRMVVTDDGSGSGDCDVKFTLSGSSCTEKESWTIKHSTDDALITFLFGGIDSCDPEGCEFGFDDIDACAVGTHTYADPIELELDNSMGDGLIRIKGLLQDAMPACPSANAVTTQWARN